ncbi:MAG: type IX secretion system sortase PorU [Bacteroidia bacterium]|nr:type IX secretion system sortase PorU [Bacteroidia bacterium]
MKTLVLWMLCGAANAAAERFVVHGLRDTVVRIGRQEVHSYRFDGALYDEHGLPYFFIQTAGKPVAEPAEAKRIYDERFRMPEAVFGEDEFYPSSVLVPGPTLTVQKKTVYTARLYPVRVHRSGLAVEIHDEIRYRVEISSAKTAEERVYASRSALADGPWYKIAVSADGIYIIDRKMLLDMGVDPSSVDPRTLKIYGRPGGMLPQANGAPRHDDNAQLAVFVHGQDDGVFDDSDYLLFYGQGPRRMFWFAPASEYRHENHLYSRETCYLLTFGGEPGKRIQTLPPGDGGLETRAFTHVEIWDDDQVNLGKAGRLWFGDKFDFDTVRTYSFTLADNVGDSVRFQIRSAANSLNPTAMTVRAGGRTLYTILYPSNAGPGANNTAARLNRSTFGAPSDWFPSGRADVALSYVKSGVSQAWLDFIRVSYLRRLAPSGAFFPFYLPASDVARRLTLERFHSGYTVWDVTDPVEVKLQQGVVEGQTFSFSSTGERWVAFSSSAFSRPKFIGKIANQNLHGLDTPDYLIVYHPIFAEQAHRLAEFHRSRGLKVHAVDVESVYNEFSAGTADATAIRDLAKMFYDRGGLRFLMLFGDGSYDNRDLMSDGGYIPTYQARQSMYSIDAYCGEDYFGMLDDDEGEWIEPGLTAADEQYGEYKVQTVDIGVGRLPVSSVEQASAVVDKILRYAGRSFGPWRTEAVLIADYKTGETNHIREADMLHRNVILPLNPLFNVDKIYISQYPAVNLADGLRFPRANEAIFRRLNAGSLFVNYTGHGGETGLSNSYILEAEDIARLRNGEKTPFWITATCNFGQFDRGKNPCGAEVAFNNPDGGAIALLTANREVFSASNFRLNEAFYQRALQPLPDGRNRTFGEIIRDCKNDVYPVSDLNTRTFCLLGDPALEPAWPKHQIVVTQIADERGNPASTLAARGRYIVKGEIRSQNGAPLSDWNGTAYITLWDKPQTFRTLLGNINYEWQKNRLFSGLASVVEGRFEISFVVPMDISYETGEGKIVVYAHNDLEDAAGYAPVVVCCTAENPVSDDAPPTVKVYIDGEDWRDGSLTGPNPELWVRISDDVGVNATGLGLGRDIAAVLNDDESNPIRLNEFFVADIDRPAQGWVKYPMRNLPEGPHRIVVKAWDVGNNSATGETRLVVGHQFAVQAFQAYPNPTFGPVGFVFNHNRAGEPLEADLTVSDALGRVVFRKQERFVETSSVCRRFVWDGNQADGSPTGDGIYFAVLRLTDADGATAVAHTRVVKMR